MKRYRNENGQLTMEIEEIKKGTEAEGRKYFRPGEIYLNMADGENFCIRQVEHARRMQKAIQFFPRIRIKSPPNFSQEFSGIRFPRPGFSRT